MVYYIDSKKEKSLSVVNDLELNPGDSVLFKRGSVFNDEGLVIKARGTKNAPILFGAYGEGELPKINTNGKGKWYLDYGCLLDAATHVNNGDISSSVLLYDSEYIILENLELTNANSDKEDICEAHRMSRTGVAVVAKDKGTLHDIVIKNLFIHHIHGNIYDKHLTNGGIYAVCITPEDENKTGVARYDGLQILNNTVIDSFRWGIAAGYTYRYADYEGAYLREDTFHNSGHINMVIKNNYVERIGGDGITAMYALKPEVSHNTAISVATHMNKKIYKYPEDRRGMVAAGIWPWKCKDADFCYNEVIDTKLNQDGQAYDCDSGDGTIYHNNFSLGNEGGTVMFCMSEAVNSEFKNNISVFDLMGIVTPAGNPDGLVKENKITLLGDTPLIRKVENPGKYNLIDNEVKKEDWND